tara:strand:- start:2063 stop:2716 length:654 start_codon:yes stop_codon:yes gene_type:complete
LISWIKGEIITSWLQNKKFFFLIDCQGLGYEIQVIESLHKNLDKGTIALWIKHVKKEDSDSFFGFERKDERDFFRDLLNIKGIGPQIGMSLLNKFTLNEIIKSLEEKDMTLINTVPGIGPKMSERIFFELKNKCLIFDKNLKNNENTTNFLSNNIEVKLILADIDMTLKSLNYSLKERKETRKHIIENFINNEFLIENDIKKITFEDLLKEALDYLK